jgi:hypothetical protein
MEAATQQQQEMRKCPACAELILPDAVKCKHCGERLDRRKRPTIPALSPEKRKKVLVAGAVALGVLLLGGLGWLAYSQVPETQLWVSMHKDVEWHRRWQDARTDDHRDRVVDIYQQLSDGSPENPDLKYLALRALPDGADKLERFQEAVKKFEKSGWMLIGLAAAQEDDGSISDATESRLKAIELFASNVPPVAYRATVVGYARDDDGEGLRQFYEKNRDAIRNSVLGATGMAEASFLLGDLDAMVKWEEHARTLGFDGPQVSAPLKKSVESLGIRPDLVGRWGVGARGVARVDIEQFSATPENGGTELVLRVKYTNEMWDEDQSLYYANFALIPTSGGKIESSALGSLPDVPRGRSIIRGIPFHVPAGTRIERLEVNTMRVRLPSRTPIISVVDLRPDPDFKVEPRILP